MVRRLETAISVLLVGVALAAPAWTKAGVLLFRVALLLWIVRMLAPPRPRLRPLAITKPMLLYILLAAFPVFFLLNQRSVGRGCPPSACLFSTSWLPPM